MLPTQKNLANSKIPFEGVLLVDKPKGKSSFSLVSILRKILDQKKIGHAGTLDPMATGVMILLVGKRFTTLSDQFLSANKEYLAEITLGVSTDSYDGEGKITGRSSFLPSLEEIEKAIATFQGNILQIPPMFSAKKIGGKKLYELARNGQTIDRLPVEIAVNIKTLEYEYPKISLRIACSKGTYIRSIAHDLGQKLGCGAYLSGLIRTKSGQFDLEECLPGRILFELPLDQARQMVQVHLQKPWDQVLPKKQGTTCESF